MGRRRLSLGVAVLAMVIVPASVASAGKPVMPESGRYYGREVGSPQGGTVSVREIEVKVVKAGKGQGAEVNVSAFPATCTGELTSLLTGFVVLEKSPIPIKDGKFKFDRTTQEPVAGGNGSARTRTLVTGAFKSATKVVVKVSVSSDLTVQYPGQSAVRGTCTGKETLTAKHV